MKLGRTTAIVRIAIVAAAAAIIAVILNRTSSMQTGDDTWTDPSWHLQKAQIPVARSSGPSLHVSEKQETLPSMDALRHPTNHFVDVRTASFGLMYSIATTNRAAFESFRTVLLRSGTNATPFLAKLLTCGIPAVEVEAMRLLVQSGDVHSLSLVLARMLSIDLSSHDSGPYIAVFSECNSRLISEWLTDSMVNGYAAKLRQQSALLLDILRGPETAISICTLAERAVTPERQQIQLLEMIAGRGDPSEVVGLIEVFSSIENQDVKAAVAEALAVIGTPESCAFLVGVSRNRGPDAELALSVIPLISSSYAQETLLATALNGNLSEAIRVAAVSALDTSNSQNVKIALSNIAISDSEADLRTAVNTVLANCSANQEEHAHGTTGGNHEICF